MDSPGEEQHASDSHVGLCGSCLYLRLVLTSRGSTFYLCRRSEKDPRFARYPRLPVIKCPGFEQDLELSTK
jgi:hypothetical protein